MLCRAYRGEDAFTQVPSFPRLLPTKIEPLQRPYQLCPLQALSPSLLPPSVSRLHPLNFFFSPSWSSCLHVSVFTHSEQLLCGKSWASRCWEWNGTTALGGLQPSRGEGHVGDNSSSSVTSSIPTGTQGLMTGKDT